MNADDCNGRSYMSGSGDSSTEREFFAGLRGPTVSTPNSQQSSPSRSLSANSIKVELYSDEEAAGAPLAERRVGEKDEGWKDEKGELAEDGGVEMVGGTQGQAGSGFGEMASSESASPGPIRLPNGKLKCDICGMICIGPNVLMVHKRSHTGERPFQCNQCGASFTQKGNLLRHIKLHSGEKPFKCPFCNYACRRRDALTGHLRTHSVSSPTVGKPYKCSYCGRSYKQQSTLEEHRERCHSYLQSLDHQPAHNTQPAHGDESHNVEMMSEPLIQSSSEKMTFIDRLANSITKRKRSTPQKFLGEKHMRLNISEAPYELDPNPDKEGDMLLLHHEGDPAALAGMGGRFLRGPRGGNSTDTESMAEEQCVITSVPPGNLNHRGRERHSPSHAKETDMEGDREKGVPVGLPNKVSPRSPPAREAMQVVDGEGRSVRSFRCEHCRIFFLDHVMFTIHMGCHGFRQPFECNICGHRSQDRYEFSSHIVRGEHQVG
uniref:IKAROS family zinc finger 4 n=1 Tax=Cyprinus carpio carpio TaxID=630221 RepID=A0A8C1EFS8_CYPCA